MAQLKDTIIRGGLEVVSDSVIGTSGNLVFKDEADGGDYYGHIDVVAPDSNDTLNTRAMRISSYSKNIPEGSESEAINTLELGVNDEGVRTVNVSSPEAWRAGIDAAASSHNHSASDITSGTLPIGRGGTGATTASGALTNLGAAASSHNHSASNITSGTLPIARGGTGQTSKLAAFKAIGSWTKVAGITGTNSAAIDLSGYYEVMIVGWYSTTYIGSANFMVANFNTTQKEVYLGGGYTSGGSRRAAVKLSTTKITGVAMNIDGSSVTGNWNLYAR